MENNKSKAKNITKEEVYEYLLSRTSSGISRNEIIQELKDKFGFKMEEAIKVLDDWITVFGGGGGCGPSCSCV